MTRIDETQEALARIRMTVDLHNAALLKANQELDSTAEEPTMNASERHWSLGSQLNKICASEYELNKRDEPGFRHFERRLRNFIADYIDADECPAEPLEVTANFIVVKCTKTTFRFALINAYTFVIGQRRTGKSSKTSFVAILHFMASPVMTSLSLTQNPSPSAGFIRCFHVTDRANLGTILP